MLNGGIYLHGEDDGPWMAQLAVVRSRISDTKGLLDWIADKVILPALARNYDNSGLKVHRSVLKRAVSKRGALGNIVEIRGNVLTVGIDVGAVPEAEPALDGRKMSLPINKKALRWYDDNGKAVFSKRSRATGPHELYYLTAADLEACQEAVDRWALFDDGQ